MNTTNIDIFNIPIFTMGEYLGVVFLSLVCLLGFVLFFFMFITLGKRLDRYRIKYGFDKDIEVKDIEGLPDRIQSKLADRELRFKRRTFKD